MVDARGNVDFEYLILGAGPAGLQLGHHLSRAGRSYLILERGDSPGELFRKLRRHRNPISGNTVFSAGDDPELDLCFDWSSLPGDDAQLAECCGLQLRCNAHITRVQKIQHGFRLHDAEGNAFTCRRLLVAAGLAQRIPDAPGSGFDNSFFDESCRPEPTLDGRFPAMTCEWESTNAPGIYFAGTISRSRDGKSASGLRYSTRALFRMLEKKHHGKPWPAQAVEPTSDGLATAMIERVNKTSAMWQQPSFLHDLIVMPDNGGPARHYRELPLAYIQETDLSASSHYYTIATESGEVEGDPFAALPDPRAAQRILRPVVRRWNGPLLVAEHCLRDGLFGEWQRAELRSAALREFLHEQMRERVRVLAGWN